jgi:serine phosphatase RsbU (regulator of sigma subunit)
LTVSLPLSRPVAAGLSLYADGGTSVSEHWEPLAQLTAERMAITVEADRLREDDLRRRSWLTFLAEASELLAQSLDVRLTLALVPQIVVPRLGEWCVVHVVDEWGDLRLAASMHADEAALPTLQRLLGPTNQELPGRLREALLTQSPVALDRPLEGIVVPLSARGKALGTLSVGRPPHRLHGADDVAVIEDVSRRASLAIDNSRTHAERAEIAQAFQRALLPSALPSAVGLEFGSEYVSASSGTDVGGDFYDVIEVAPRRWLVAIGDVCGKGAQAAALTGLVRDVIRVLVRDGRCLPRAIQLLNRTLIEQHDDGRYCTLAAAMVARSGEDLEVELCLAGHERPMLVRVNGEVEQVGVNGTAVGLLDDVLLRPTAVTLTPGEALVFFTDGVTERRHGDELYGPGRLRRELTTLAGHSAQVVAARVRGAALSFSEDPPRDDIAILVVRNLGAQHNRAHDASETPE